MTNIIDSLLNLIGITTQPTTINELLWDIVLLFVSLIIIKWIVSAMFNVFKYVTKL